MALRTRQELEEIEEQILASYASKSGKSKGRIYSEEEHPRRTAFQRDRDRIIHSRAFRRLEYKTQVFVNHEGDHYRTRLTHTMEVAQISRNIARALQLNEDLTEAVSLAHDVGHPPFGHSGEKALDFMMKNMGGFEHNRQSLRIVEKLERRYPQFEGLNLTWEVREGIQKHRPGLVANCSSLEAQVADLSDDIAYLCHDVDDGLASSLMSEEVLSQIEIWAVSFEEIRKNYPDAPAEIRCYYTVRNMINTLVTDLIEQTEKTIQEISLNNPDELNSKNIRVVNFSPSIRKKVISLREFLFKNLYAHEQVDKMNQRAYKVICDLFQLYIKQPELLQETTQAKLKEGHLKQVVCDYIAGMTDRFALNEHRRHFELEGKF